MADSLERELAAAKKRTRELEKQLELRRELEKVREREKELLKALKRDKGEKRSRSRERGRRRETEHRSYERDRTREKRHSREHEKSKDRYRSEERGRSEEWRKSRERSKGKKGKRPEKSRTREREVRIKVEQRGTPERETRKHTEPASRPERSTSSRAENLEEKCRKEGWVRAPSPSASQCSSQEQECDDEEDEESEEEEPKEQDCPAEVPTKQDSKERPPRSPTSERKDVQRGKPGQKGMPKKPWTGPIPASQKAQESNLPLTLKPREPSAPKVPPPAHLLPKGKGKAGPADWALWRIATKRGKNPEAKGSGNKGDKGKGKGKFTKGKEFNAVPPPNEDKLEATEPAQEVKAEEDPGFQSPSDDDKSNKSDPEIPTAGNVIRKFFPDESGPKKEGTPEASGTAASSSNAPPAIKEEKGTAPVEETKKTEVSTEKPVPTENQPEAEAEIEKASAESSKTETDEKPSDQALMVCEEEAMAALDDDMILVDTGATGNLVTSTLLERYCPPGLVEEINPENRRKYRYANNEYEVCSSQARIRTRLGTLTLDVREADTSKPSLLGIRTIRECQLDMKNLRLIPLSKNGEAVQLVELPSGHLGIRAKELFSAS